jgi:subtilisin-like proprotein convertase family protein
MLRIALIGFLFICAMPMFGQDAGDNPCNATPLAVGASCSFATYTNANASATAGVPAPGCGNYNGGDVWFSVVVPPSGVLIIDSNTGIVTDGAMALYSGTCTTLTLLACDDDGSANGLMPAINQTGLTPGSTVFIRFWDPNNNNNGTFQICAKAGAPCTNLLSNASCSSADPFCSGVSTDYCNTTNVASLGGGGIYGCLGSTPNPAFYFFQVSQSGTISFNISQTTNSGIGIDVDYVMWGPFATQSAMCAGLAATNIVACSYSAAAVETATITGAVAGQYYMVLITNFSNLPGVINFTQTNTNQTGAGTTNCNILTAVPSSCNGANYTVAGTLTIPGPPATGTLTISNSCGGSVTLNAPFTNPINYSIPTNVCGNGATCSVSAVFSAVGAPVISAATYIAPTCGTFTAVPGACSGSTYVLSGTLNPACPPSSGTLTITNSCGGSLTFTLPQTYPLNWSLPASSGNGGTCTVTATYSAAGAPVIPPLNFNEPTCCGVSAGTQTVTLTGGGIVNNLPNGNRQVILCPSASVSIVSDNNAILPVAGCGPTPPPGCTPGLMYAIYNSAGPSGPDPDLDPNWTGYYWTGGSFPGNNTQNLNTNVGGACSPILNLSSVTGFAPTNSPTNTLVFVPITADALNLPNHDNNNDGCFDLGNYVSITYLNPIVFNVTNSCNGAMTVEINGGYPQFFPGLYTITNTGSGALSSTQVTSGGNVSISGLTNGQTVSFSVIDASGCSYVFSRVYSAQAAPIITLTPVNSNVCSGCVNLNAVVNSGVAAGSTTTFTNSLCKAIPDAGVTATNTGQFSVGSWASSPINVSGFCGATWSTGQPLTVCLNISHAWDEDLNAYLQAPNGTVITLFQDIGSQFDNFVNTCFSSTATNVIGGTGPNQSPPFTGTYAPASGSFNALNGTPINGVWTLWVSDDAAIVAGSLSSWSVTFTAQNSYTYSWSASSGTAPANTSLTPTVCPTASTVYTLTATNSCGCISTATAAVTIVTPSSAGTNGTAAVCLNSPSINLFNYLGGTPATTGTWTGQAGASLTGGYLGTINPASAPAGVYTYTINATGCPPASATVTLTINPLPTVSYSGSTAICSGQTTGLTLSSPTSASATFSWTVTQAGVGGASSSVGSSSSINQTLTLTGASAGTATYSVVAAANGCQGNPVPIVVNVAPLNSAASPSSNPTVCTGASISPSITIATTGATGIGIPSGLPAGVNATWASNTITITGSPSAVGTYTYTIPLTGGCGTVNATGTITVIAGNTAGTPSSSPTLCTGVAINPVITISTTGATGIGTISGLPAGVSASWSANTITISGTPTAVGSFNYTIPLTGGCGSAAATGSIIVNQTPTVTANATSFSTCAGPDGANASAPSITLSSPQAGTVFNWSLYAGSAATGAPIQIGTGNPNYQFTNNTCSDVSYVYQVIPSLNGCNGAPLNIAVTVRPKPTSLFTVTPNPICSNQTATVIHAGVACAGSTYNWTWPSGVTVVSGTGAGPYVISFGTLASATTYALKLQVVGPSALGGCTSTQTTVNLVVNPTITPSFSTVGPNCSGASIPALPTTSINGITGTWNPAINNTSTTLYTFTPATGQCATSTTLTIAITPNATPTFASVGPFCSGALIAALPTTSTNNISGTWSPAINNTTTTTYTFTPAVGQCATTSQTTIIIDDVLDFFNLQFPANGTICQTGSFTAFGQVYNNGIINTIGAGQAAGVSAQIGYSSTNTNPSTWTNWSDASFNPGVTGNNDEYSGTLSGLTPGIYYYAFRYQINNCDWQYGGYSSSGGGTWGGANVSGVLTVVAPPNAGTDGTVSACASGTPVNLFGALGGTPNNTGSWSGPSGLDNEFQGTYDPIQDNPGAYTYTITDSNNVCPPDNSVITVSETSSPQASIAYASPVCANVTTLQTPVINGAQAGTFTASPGGLGLTAAGTFNPTTATPGTYTITYNIDAANGCSAFQTQTTVVVQGAPLPPVLNPVNPCSATDSVFTATGGNWYEFLVNGVSAGPPSVNGVLDTTALAAGTQVCVRSFPQPPIMDGNLTDAAWTPVIPGTTGGPTSQTPFTIADTRLDGLKMLNRNGLLYFAVAGNEIDGTLQVQNNRILLFIDSKPGGFNSLSTWINRSNAGPPAFTFGIRNLDGGIQFDPGFEADYILSINRANDVGSTTFYDLYDMVTNTNAFLGSSPSAQFGYLESFIDNDLTRGFEFYIPLAAIGAPSSLKVFGMLINDPGEFAATLVSNQFFSVAGGGDGNYGNGAIFFGQAAPNPVTYVVSQDCYEQGCVTLTQPVVSQFTAPAPICAGGSAPVLPTSSNNVPPIIGTWSGPISNQASGTYTFTPAAGQCATGTTLPVTVNAVPVTVGIFHD